MRRHLASRVFGRMGSWGLKPNQRLRWRKAGVVYMAVWIGLLAAGLHQQANLILLIAGMAAGPIVASFLVSAAMLRKIRVTRRGPAFVFSGEPLIIDYTLENFRRSTSVLALGVEDVLAPVDRTVPGGVPVLPRLTFDRVAPGAKGRLRWAGPTPNRGRYRFTTMELVTGSPFGLIERRVVVTEPSEILIYPRIGHLARRWNQLHREATQTKKGRRHDRTAQQQEYHGLREYRAGDSPRWIHWRTTARIGKPMVKEFEQQNDQDLAILLDPWLPRTKVTPEQRETLEAAIRFAATVCVESCRQAGRRILLGWTGATPGVRQGPASAKLLHELLEQLAVMRPAPEGQMSVLLDALPPACLREAMLVMISTRPVNLADEAERSSRLSGGASRGIAGRVLLLDASQGDLTDLIHFDEHNRIAASRRAEVVE
ncbi:MAG: hypothetical protein JWN86_2428 [Planctomycetota bacterium]|nr:hypothetical protein [Planctomycetota bacterium]